MKKCLVTGVSGFIGSKIADRLILEGYNVVGLIHDNKPKEKNEKIQYVFGDIRNKNSLKDAVKDVDIVFHCAAIVKDYGPKKIFDEINYKGTKNLVEICEKEDIEKFVFLSHIHYESDEITNHYTRTKIQAEKYLIKKHKEKGFPVVIIKPGNVYGPGATTWVLRPLKSIQNNKIRLVDDGKGIFLHTYIDNLTDALTLAIKSDNVLGEKINITDGDNSVNWKDYFNFLSDISNTERMNKSISKNKAMFYAKIMVFLNKIFKIEPWVTPMAVRILTNKKTIDIKKAEELLGYKPRVDYKKGKKNVEKWLKKSGYI